MRTIPTGRIASPTRNGGRTNPYLVEMTFARVLDMPATMRKGMTSAAERMGDLPMTWRKTGWGGGVSEAG